jgi:hypothetical protein
MHLSSDLDKSSSILMVPNVSCVPISSVTSDTISPHAMQAKAGVSAFSEDNFTSGYLPGDPL